MEVWFGFFLLHSAFATSLCMTTSEVDLKASFSEYNLTEIRLLDESPFLCPSTFLTSSRILLHDDIFQRYLPHHTAKPIKDGEVKKKQKIKKPFLFLFIGSSGAGKSTLIEHLRETRESCPTIRHSIDDFSFDGTSAIEQRNTFSVLIPENSFEISSDSLMVDLPEYAAYLNWLSIQPKNNRTIYVDVANSCHTEATQLAQALALSAITQNLDVVFEGTGSRSAFLFELVDLARISDYTIHLVHVNSKLDVAITRTGKRFQETGRGVPVEIVKRSYFLSRRTFRQLGPLTDYASVWKTSSGDVPPFLCEKGFVREKSG